MNVNSKAGNLADVNELIDPQKLISSYYSLKPDPDLSEQRISFGTSGHRGSSFYNTFNENHILAITQAICFYRQKENIKGPLFIGIDTHALSIPAQNTALEVLAANGINVMMAKDNEFTPTPAISHAILVHNRQNSHHISDGIVITPSHNPPGDGGFKYNPPTGGPADEVTTRWIESMANEILKTGLKQIKRLPLTQALNASTTHYYNYIDTYISDLDHVLDMSAISRSNLHLAVDPMGGAGVRYWKKIADRYNLNLTILNNDVDPTFRFMRIDWDGQIRMDPSSPFVMKGLIQTKDLYDISFACDTDHDRHGIITRSIGLLPTNHYLSVAVIYLFQHRPLWNQNASVGKSVVSSRMIDLASAKINRFVYEVPVGFKWYVEGLFNESLAIAGEESAGITFSCKDGSSWTTDKDGITSALLSAEIMAITGKDPGLLYLELAKEFHNPVSTRVDAKATKTQKEKLKKLSKENIHFHSLGGEKILSILTHAPGNGAPIGGIKVITENSWFAARPSGTEEIYKIYAESFLGEEHLKLIVTEAQALVDEVIKE